MNLNDQSPIKGKTWGRCSKKELLTMIQNLLIRDQQMRLFIRHQDIMLNGCRDAV